MEQINSLVELEQRVAQQPGLVVLFGGEHCGVCQVIKPKLVQLLADQYPQMQSVYIDCQQATDVCAQNSIFSLPVVQVYFEGQKFIEKARSFSLPGLMTEIQRPYEMMFD